MKKQFALWRINYNKTADRFEAQQPEWIGYAEEANKHLPCRTWSQESQWQNSRKIAFIGDQALVAKERLLASLDSNIKPQWSAKTGQ